ncbi:MAG: hypothetical protein QNJ47_17790 [Nostocaceae cyanobacterium]|nr:hypothetical protein [Nostocaceae cyanobacterium]
MKYFFLSEGWTIGRVWGTEGLWQVAAWRRQPDIQRLNICLVEKSEVLWLYRVEDAILTVEVKSTNTLETGKSSQNIGKVILSRLISAEQVIERLESISAMCQLQNLDSVVI